MLGAVKIIGLVRPSMPIRSQGGSVHRAMVAIARHVACVAVEGVPGDQPEVQTGRAVGIVAFRTGDVFVPVVKPIPVAVVVPGNVYVDAGLVSVEEEGVETACRIVPVSMMSVGFADLPAGIERSVFIPIPEGFDVIIPVLEQLKGVGTRSVRQGKFGHFLPIFKGPDDHRTGHGPGIAHGAG